MVHTIDGRKEHRSPCELELGINSKRTDDRRYNSVTLAPKTLSFNFLETRDLLPSSSGLAEQRAVTRRAATTQRFDTGKESGWQTTSREPPVFHEEVES